MELYLFRPEEHYRLYGCANITVEDVPLEMRQHITEGVITIVLCAIYYILYIPCIPSIYRHMNNPCYKILFYISMVDFLILWIPGFVHGYLAIIGAVFCSYPNFIYLVGCYVMCIWTCETSGQIILVINRCVSMLSSELENTMFGGRRLYFWLAASVAWAIYWWLYVIPILFTGIYFSWFFNPYVGYRDDFTSDYVSIIHPVWDGSFAVSVPVLYIIFAILFFAKSYKMQTSTQISKQQKMMLLQVFIISMLNFTSASTYVVMMFMVPNEFIIHFAQFCWFHIHGIPPVIYLLFNPTIREDAKKMLIKILNIKNNKIDSTKFSPSSTNQLK